MSCLVRSGKVRISLRSGLVRHCCLLMCGAVDYGKVWSSLVRYGPGWFGHVRYGRVLYGVVRFRPVPSGPVACGSVT